MTERRKSTLQPGAVGVMTDDTVRQDVAFQEFVAGQTAAISRTFSGDPAAERAWLASTGRRALAWLAEHNGAGVFTMRGVLLAAGELAPVMRATWNTLLASAHVEPAGANRIRLTDAGRAEAERHDAR